MLTADGMMGHLVQGAFWSEAILAVAIQEHCCIVMWVRQFLKSPLVSDQEERAVVMAVSYPVRGKSFL